MFLRCLLYPCVGSGYQKWEQESLEQANGPGSKGDQR